MPAETPENPPDESFNAPEPSPLSILPISFATDEPPANIIATDSADSNLPARRAVTAADIRLRNGTNYTVNIAELLSGGATFDVTNDGAPAVLIIHTHGTESFTPCADFPYSNTKNYRSQDETLNVIALGDAIADIFRARGISVLHDRNIYDYPRFQGSYGRALEALNVHLAENPEIQIVFDIHRDAIIDASGNYMRHTVDIDGAIAAPIMLVVGTDASGITHPGWRDNLQFALQIQSEMQSYYPGLMRPMQLREERFNAHVRPGAVLLEFGTNKNTLPEALLSANLFAEVMANMLTSTE